MSKKKPEFPNPEDGLDYTTAALYVSCREYMEKYDSCPKKDAKVPDRVVIEASVDLAKAFMLVDTAVTMLKKSLGEFCTPQNN